MPILPLGGEDALLRFVDEGAFEGGEVRLTSPLSLLSRKDGESLKAGAFAPIPLPLHGVGDASGDAAEEQVRRVSGGECLIGGEGDGGIEAGHMWVVGGGWVVGTFPIYRVGGVVA